MYGLYCYFFEWWIANCHTNSTSRIFQSSPFSISQFPILDSWISHLENSNISAVAILFRGSGLDCQLTFEHFCAEILELYVTRVVTFKEGWFSLSFPIFPYYFSIHQHFSLLFYVIFFLRERHTKCSHVLEISSKLGNCCNIVRYW